MSLEEYRTDNLLLLVGSNPLPNLVAAELLLKENGDLYLIHTDETASVADNLKAYLPETYKVCLPPAVKATDAGHIRATVEKLAANLRGTVGLHYTGGTKAMAVHAYRAVERALAGKSPAPVFSYLDADTFCLRIDDPVWSEPVLLKVKPTLEQLAKLHGSAFQKGLPKRKESLVLLPVAEALAHSAENGGLQSWREWCDEELKKKTRNDRNWKGKAELVALELRLPISPVLAEVITTLRTELEVATESATLPLDPLRLRWPFPKKDPVYLCKWLDGEWLEHYVLSQIVQIADELQIHDLAMNIKTDSNSSAFDFEFDVAAMRGYQLFGISCTTDVDKDMAKLKLFEAYVRAQQLGGDEARVGFVCGYEDAQRFEKEVLQAWRAKGRIKVFGPADFPKLAEKLKEWFETAQ